mgnify:CR=1 FL=1
MYTSFIGLNIDFDKEDSITDALMELEPVIEVYTMMQPFDMFIKVTAENQKGLESAVESILKIDGVRKTYNFLTVQQKKGK